MAMADQTAGLVPQTTTTMGQIPGQIGQTMTSAMANAQPPPLPPPASTSATPINAVATTTPVTPPPEQLTSLARIVGGAMGEGARGQKRKLHDNLHEFCLRAAQQNAARAMGNTHLQGVITALRSQPGTQVFQYVDQRSQCSLTLMQHTIIFAPQFLQHIGIDQRMHIWAWVATERSKRAVQCRASEHPTER